MEEKIVPEKIVPVAPEAERVVTPSPEGIVAPERSAGTEQPTNREGVATTEQSEAASGSVAPVPVEPVEQTPEQKAVEKILEDGLADVYAHLPENKKEKFKEVGEETAEEISTLLGKTKLHIVKIVKLILKWLSIIPGVNRAYLEQTSKLKADQIVAMHEERAKKIV